MLKTEPYFMKNEEWYYFDKKEHKYKLKPNAPREAVQSYKEYYEEDFDYTCQAVELSFVEEARNRLLKDGIPQKDVDEILRKAEDPKVNMSLKEIISEYNKSKKN